MARNKSKQPNVGAWLGGNKGYLRSGQQSDQTSAVADAGGGQMESVRGELGLGAYTVGIGTTAAIVAGVAAVKSGRAAQAVNKVTGKTVVVHGSATKNLKRINPRIAPNKPEAGSVVFASRPLAESPIDMEHISRLARHYVAERSAQAAAAKGSPITRYEGSMYVAKVPTKTLEGNWIVTSPTSAKVVKELPISGPMPYKYSDLPMEDVRKLERAFRRAGGRPLKEPKVPKTPKPKRSSGPTRS